MKASHDFRCLGPAWLFAWVAAIFLPSAAIAYFGLSPAAAAIGEGVSRLPWTTFKVGDDVGPVAKLAMGGLLALLFTAVERLAPRLGWLRYPLHALAGAASVTATLALLPASLSRGFGIGLTGARFDPATLPLYLIGGIAGGFVFAASLDRCRRRASTKPV